MSLGSMDITTYIQQIDENSRAFDKIYASNISERCKHKLMPFVSYYGHARNGAVVKIINDHVPILSEDIVDAIIELASRRKEIHIFAMFLSIMFMYFGSVYYIYCTLYLILVI